MADEEDFENDLQSLDGEGDEGLPAEGDDALEEGPDAAVNDGGAEEGDDEPGAGGQAGAKADQSEGAQHGQLTRGQSRQARLANELRQIKERDLAREREMNELKARLQQATQPRGETPEQRQARLDAMTTDEKFTYLLQESEHRAAQQRQYDQFMYNDRLDQDAYKGVCAADKRADKYKDEVEATLRQFRQAGFNPKREAIYHYVLGQKVANAKKAAPGQTTGVARRQAAARTAPASSGGDVGRSVRGKSLEQKLDGVLL